VLKNDIWIRQQAAAGMIEPYQQELVRKVKVAERFQSERASLLDLDWPPAEVPVLSFGTSSYGYDIRLSAAEFKIFRHVPGTVMNPKRANPANLEPTPLHQDEDGRYFILPAHTYGLGVALEKLLVPPNTTPAEAAWEGHLTLEFSNSSGADCRIYAEEGICQLLFFEGDPCETTYADRNGKYQYQPELVTLARV
jgi:dCTP deaminase